jgi:hypothetical protein
MRKRRTEITIEKHELLAIRRGAKPTVAWCPECRREVQVLTADEAAALARLSGREIFRQVEASLIHGTIEGPFLICVTSLARLIAPDRDAQGHGDPKAIDRFP